MQPYTSSSPLAFRALTDIGIIAHLSDNQLARLLPVGTSTAQFSVLNHLVRKGRAETIGQIASAMQITPATMSSTIKKMVRAGLVKLTNDDQDLRIKHVGISEKGKELRNDAMRKAEPMIANMPDMLTDAEWAMLQPLLQKLRVAMDQAR